MMMHDPTAGVGEFDDGVLPVGFCDSCVEPGADGHVSASRLYRRIMASAPDLVILDIHLPGKSGFALCKWLKARASFPILILTAMDTLGDELTALGLGADAVLIGRPIIPAIYGGGAEGFKLYMDKIVGELKSTMTMCGAASLKEITRDKLWIEK